MIDLISSIPQEVWGALLILALGSGLVAIISREPERDLAEHFGVEEFAERYGYSLERESEGVIIMRGGPER
mgnify:CR=1 FL=1